MPFYDYECNNCGHVFEEQRSVANRHGAPCPKCMGETTLLIRTRPGVIIFEPYVSPTFRRKITSTKEKRRLMDERGLEEFDSVDEVHKEAEQNWEKREKEFLEKPPDERFYRCFEKARAEHPE